MKKFLTLLMVLGMVTTANATIIDVVKDGTGSAGHAGTASDRLDIGETILIQLVLNDNDWVSSRYGEATADYDGYVLSGFDVSMTVGSSGKVMKKGGFGGAVSGHLNFALFGIVGFDDTGDNFIDNISGASSLTSPIAGANGPIPLVWNFKVEALSGGIINVDLGMNMGSTGESLNQYGDFPPSLSPDPVPVTFEWKDMAQTDFSNLDLYVVPEPMTISLLGIGCLGMLYRRRRA